jgi:hypothetical protein
MMREASARGDGSGRPGGAHGELGGAGVRVIADAEWANSGLARADESVSYVLHPVGEFTIYNYYVRVHGGE